jgi:hypothetical protein
MSVATWPAFASMTNTRRWSTSIAMRSISPGMAIPHFLARPCLRRGIRIRLGAVASRSTSASKAFCSRCSPSLKALITSAGASAHGRPPTWTYPRSRWAERATRRGITIRVASLSGTGSRGRPARRSPSEGGWSSIVIRDAMSVCRVRRSTARAPVSNVPYRPSAAPDRRARPTPRLGRRANRTDEREWTRRRRRAAHRPAARSFPGPANGGMVSGSSTTRVPRPPAQTTTWVIGRAVMAAPPCGDPPGIVTVCGVDDM